MKIRNRVKCLYKVTGSLVLLVVFMAQGAWLRIRHGSGPARRKATVRLVSAFCGRILALFNVRVHMEYHHGEWPLRSPVVLISNHLSFLDVFILAARFPAIFVTSTELRDAFLLGWVSRLSGCLFVNRRNPRRLHQEMDEIKKVLKDNFSVTFFPESTSSNGEQVLPFRPALFTVPLATGTPVMPVVLNYRAVNGVYDPESFKRNVFYYGDHNFFVQLWRVLNVRSIDVSVSTLPADSFLDEAATKATRQKSARHFHERISSRYTPLVPQEV